MPSLARPEVDVLDGLTTAILVDQRRMGADARSTVAVRTVERGTLWRLLGVGLAERADGLTAAESGDAFAVLAGDGAVAAVRAG